jgi:membrane protein DedA with SNARE-associated domain|tara:strand:+ start:97 stop:306 length:210 start_codon:yes stop_codon:yes gene_type:complete
MNIEKYLLLNWKKILIIIVAWFLAVILHNAFYAVFNIEEAVFFIIAVIIIPIYVIISIIYTIISKIKKK